MEVRSRIIETLYKFYPFDLNGDLILENKSLVYKISCIINFYGRPKLLRNILSSLSCQDIDNKYFEVIMVEDNNGTLDGKNLCNQFRSRLNISYFALDNNFGYMGYSRNYALSKSSGEIILFLDDDTVILQKNFLSLMKQEFSETNADGIIPKGTASFCSVKDKYQYHDPFYPSSRCMAYTRKVLAELRGFISTIIGQEDVEFVIRTHLKGKILLKTEKLNYFHPPLIYSSKNKAASVGKSYYNLKNKYSFIIWLFLLLNGMRYLPFYFIPVNKKYKMLGLFSYGFLIGIIYGITNKDIEYN